MRKVLNKKNGRPKKETGFLGRVDRTALTKENLINMLLQAKKLGAKFYAIQLKFAGCENLETVINLTASVDYKIDYYSKSYDDDLYLIANKDIQIVNFTFGATWGEVKQECI